jgi:hypothetical protein
MNFSERQQMEDAQRVSVWASDWSLFPNGGLLSVEGPAARVEVHVHNANLVPIFDVSLLAADPTAPPGSAKACHMEWPAIAPSSTETVFVEFGIWQTDDNAYEGDPDLEITFTDILDRSWGRRTRGNPFPVTPPSAG